MYSWSTDSTCWTNWVDFNTYNTICINIEGDYYLRILIMAGFEKIAYDGSYIDCYSLCLFTQNPYVQDLCSSNVLDLYCNLDCALQMQQQLSDLICCMIGIPVYYFRVAPDADTKDLTFKEYVLHNVVEMKYIKLLCMDGQLPSSKPQMTEFDFDWDNDWEVECSKTAFATAFGDTAFPKQRDIIYVPMMKRLYEVNAAYDEKQEALMWRAVTWKLALVKWNEKTNVDQGDFESIIDDLAINQAMDYLPQERIEQERESGIAQTEAPTFAATNLINIFIQDAVRAQVTDSEKENIKELSLAHGSVTVTRNFYNFKDLRSMVVYQNQWCGESGTLSLIMKYELINDDTDGSGSDEPITEKRIFSTGYIDLIQYNDTYMNSEDDTRGGIDFGGIECRMVPGRFYLVVARWDRSTFSQSLNVYEYRCNAPSNLPPYKIRRDMYKFEFNDPICETTIAYNNDYITEKPSKIMISPSPSEITNIRLYDISLDDETMLRESLKYTTTNEHCVINDVARPIESSHGYSTR